MSTVIMVLTSHDGHGALGRPTGAWLEELATPYLAFLDAGADERLCAAAPDIALMGSAWALSACLPAIGGTAGLS
jgi:hypothetical protein